MLLASPFSTPAADSELEDVDVNGGLVAEVVVVLALPQPTEEIDRLWVVIGAAVVDFIVGVTVADGFVETNLCFSTANGRIGFVVVEAPTMLGNGAGEGGIILAVVTGLETATGLT